MTYLLKPIFSPCRGDFITIYYKPVYNPKRSSSFNSELPWPTSKSRAASSSSSYSSSPASSCESRDLSSSFSPFFKSRAPRSSLSCPSCKSGAPCSYCKSRVSSSSPPPSYSYCKSRVASLSSCYCKPRVSSSSSSSSSSFKYRVSSSSPSSFKDRVSSLSTSSPSSFKCRVSSSSPSPSPSPSSFKCRVSSLSPSSFKCRVSSLSPSSSFKYRVSSSSSSSSSYNGVEETSLNLGWFPLSRREAEIVGRAASTIMFAVANKILYKMALVPLREYPFLLALITTFGYVLVYFSILCMRYQAGIVTDEMLELPKYYFILSGALEACGVASGMAAAAVLPGPSISILLQTFLVWQLLLSMVFLKRQFSLGQITGCIMVLLGVIVALSGSGIELSFSGGGHQMALFWPLLMIVSCAFQASSTIVKEFVFRNACKNLKGSSVDIFVVNSFGSAFQAMFVVLMLPFLSHLRGIPFSQLPAYMKDGAGCLFNIGSVRTECSGAMPLVFGFVVVNLAFNISLLSLLKMSSAVVSSLCSTVAVPITIFMFTLPLPYIGASASLHPRFVVGTIILLSGLAFYNYYACFKPKSKDSCDNVCDPELFHQEK